MKFGNADGAKAPCSEVNVQSRKSPVIDENLITPLDSVRTLQNALQAKAKSEATFRFYSLWDKICREDVLHEAYRRCRANRGAPGVDGVRFEEIESQGRGSWLRRLRQELVSGQYRPQPLLRVWIPKANGGRRPLGIPPISDRVVQMATNLILQPIFDGDLSPRQYGYRAGLDAKMAIRRIFYDISQGGAREVIDADLSDYFGSIPHGELLRCVSRRVSDGKVLELIRLWLDTPVTEVIEGREVRSTVARDFVILCPKGKGEQSMAVMQTIMRKLGLTVNEKKTHQVSLPEERFDFLGYTIGQFFGRGGRTYWGTRPSKKSIKRLKEKIHHETSKRWNEQPIEKRVLELNTILNGWKNYFDQGPVQRCYHDIDYYTARRLRTWMQRRRGRRGTGYRHYSDSYLYETLGLVRMLRTKSGDIRSNAKV